jgi:hypothetical protein
MGPAKYCSFCNGLHPEGLHYTVRGTLAPEPALASTLEQGNAIAPDGTLPEGHDGMKLPPFVRNWDRAH